MKFFLATITGALAFWQLYDLQFENEPAFLVISLLYASYGLVWLIREYNKAKSR